MHLILAKLAQLTVFHVRKQHKLIQWNAQLAKKTHIFQTETVQQRLIAVLDTELTMLLTLVIVSLYYVFNVSIVNTAPRAITLIGGADVVVYDDRSYTWTLDFDYDVEYDTAEFTVKLLEDDGSTEVSPTPTWFKINQNMANHRVSFMVEEPQPVTPGTNDVYYIEVKLSDGLLSNTYTFKLTVKTNNAPVYASPAAVGLLIPDFAYETAGFEFDYEINESLFRDAESDDYTVYCHDVSNEGAGTLPTSWLKISSDATRGWVVSGTPPRNTLYEGKTFIVTCTVDDYYESSEYDFEFTVGPNADPVLTATVDPVSSLVNLGQTAIITYSCTDPEGVTPTLTILVNGTSIEDAPFAAIFDVDVIAGDITFIYDD